MRWWQALAERLKSGAREQAGPAAAKRLAAWFDGADGNPPISPDDIRAAAAQDRALIMDLLDQAPPEELRAARAAIAPILRRLGKPSYRSVLQALEWTHPEHVRAMVESRTWTHRQMDAAWEWLTG